MELKNEKSDENQEFTWFYVVPDDSDVRYELGTKYRRCFESFVPDFAAEEFYKIHGGADCQWPLNFDIYNQNGAFVGKYKIEIKLNPEFISKKIAEGDVSKSNI